ncbi:bifunctional non-homologous end joining protein LigD [Rhizobiales bacterium GAS191]|nr:bifunctional non-homologous end joining protein LigD [Rhizobiales bacterium GAS191]
MARPPRKPREIRRSTDVEVERVVSRPVVARRADRRQPSLFDVEPQWIAPALPTLVRTPPSGPEWFHELKHDGYRMVSVIGREKVSMHTRRGRDWASRLPGIVADLADLDLRSAVIDGEAVMPGEDGISDFSLIHAALARGEALGAVLIAFDLMHLDGEDLRQTPLEERRAILQALLRRGQPLGVYFSEAVVGDGPAALRAACEIGLEGIVSKRRSSLYRSGKVDSWRKTKCTTTEQFAVIGAEPRWGAVQSLRLARLTGELVPCGWAASGLSESAGRKLRIALDAGTPVVAEIEHRGLTSAGELRHPVVRSWHAG